MLLKFNFWVACQPTKNPIRGLTYSDLSSQTFFDRVCSLKSPLQPNPRPIWVVPGTVPSLTGGSCVIDFYQEEFSTVSPMVHTQHIANPKFVVDIQCLGFSAILSSTLCTTMAAFHFFAHPAAQPLPNFRAVDFMPP